MRALLCSVVLVAASLPLSAAAGDRPIVVELFTSEGCSSCPPADALLTRLAQREDVLPLAFHVTYWNALGWRDPFSLELATQRQAAYAGRLGGGSYTPEMVVDGQRGVVGSDEREVGSAITASRGDTVDATPVKLVRGKGDIHVSIGPGRGKGEVLLIGYDPRHETRIGRGENRGRTLSESNIVRSMRRIANYDGGAMQLTARPGPGEESAVLIQAPSGRILGAARS